ncbi:hypothetical protein E4T56_gene6061 [Termitomyces sp. T112]|nr:hypothetical protein E4T56_gene6061 [Termitomyces sp. T112]
MPSKNEGNQPAKRLPPLASWPTIKILAPPKGRFSPKTDEWCWTYCSQSVTGRYHGKEPTCRSVCIRKVFPHEVRNIVAFKTHRNLGPDGKARYPLPSEGQPANLPRWLGGKLPIEDEDEDAPWHKPPPEPIKHWDEGWYLWTSSSRYAIHEKLNSMRRDLPGQQKADQQTEFRREVWQEYQAHLEKGDQSADASKWWGPIVPLQPFPEFRSKSLLVPFPLESPLFWDRMSKVFAPTHKALDIFQEMIQSAEAREFAERIWHKAWTKDPFVLVSKTFSMWYKMLKDSDTSPDDDRKST